MFIKTLFVIDLEILFVIRNKVCQIPGFTNRIKVLETI